MFRGFNELGHSGFNVAGQWCPIGVFRLTVFASHPVPVLPSPAEKIEKKNPEKPGPATQLTVLVQAGRAGPEILSKFTFGPKPDHRIRAFKLHTVHRFSKYRFFEKSI